MIFQVMKEFTMGGQMTMHAWRMISQASKAVVYFTIIISILVYIWFFSVLSDPYERYLVKEHIFAKYKIEFNRDNYYRSMDINAPDGRMGTIMIGKFVNSGGSALAIKRVTSAAWKALFATIGSSIFIFLLVVVIFVYRSKKISSSKSVRGSSLVESHELTKLINKKEIASDLTLAGVPLIARSETQHLLFIGTTGAGKSVALTSLMEQVRKKNKKLLFMMVMAVLLLITIAQVWI